MFGRFRTGVSHWFRTGYALDPHWIRTVAAKCLGPRPASMRCETACLTFLCTVLVAQEHGARRCRHIKTERDTDRDRLAGMQPARDKQGS